jgi:hypothetical protein
MAGRAAGFKRLALAVGKKACEDANDRRRTLDVHRTAADSDSEIQRHRAAAGDEVIRPQTGVFA